MFAKSDMKNKEVVVSLVKERSVVVVVVVRRVAGIGPGMGLRLFGLD
jgi:hypothetical protein